MSSLEGQVWLITGATGIGGATARLAESRGATVFCCSLADGPHVAHVGDLSHDGVADAAINRCLDRHGRIDALFNVAGMSGRSFGDGPLHECSEAGWDTTLANNVRSMFLVSRGVLRHFLDIGRGGAILNMASVVARSPEPEHFATHAYAASKGAVLALTRSLAAYYAPHGVRVNAISPGLVATPMSRRAQSDEAIVEFMSRKQPLANGLLPAASIAEAAVFLLSPAARHITGQEIVVDGGWEVS